jgi:hypothetical protein
VYVCGSNRLVFFVFITNIACQEVFSLQRLQTKPGVIHTTEKKEMGRLERETERETEREREREYHALTHSFPLQIEVAGSGLPASARSC